MPLNVSCMCQTVVTGKKCIRKHIGSPFLVYVFVCVFLLVGNCSLFSARSNLPSSD